MVFRRVEKDDMRRIVRVSGGSIVLLMVIEGGEEIFELLSLGYVEFIYEERVGDNEFIFIEGFVKIKV